MNRLSTEKRARVISMLVEGSSMASISRVLDVNYNTVMKLLVDAGEACATFHDEAVRNVRSRRVQCDEIWSFCYAKEKNVRFAKSPPKEAGDVWTWVALCADMKLVISYTVGDRTSETAIDLMDDLRRRLENRVQLTTDGHKAYFEAVEGAFGGDVDYAQLIKLYGGATGREGHERKYSPAECMGTRKEIVEGTPDRRHISTSYVERQNLTMRMSMRRFTRLTNAFSRKLANHIHMLSLYFVHYNFCRIHKTLKVTPAMEAGLDTTVRDAEWIVGLIDARAPKPNRPKTYRKRRLPESRVTS